MYRTDATHSVSGSIAARRTPQTIVELPKLNRIAVATKRSLDVVGALIFLIALLPLYLVIAAAVRTTSPGPILYAQKRAGRGGRLFTFYKFRSMSVNSEHLLNSFLDTDPRARQEWQQFQKISEDPRITKFGRFIRRTSLDELPQFWNVLKGDMSLVGPRPVTSAEKERYGAYWSAYCHVRPGLTGAWQVSGRSNVSYEARVKLDYEYVKNWSLLRDLQILTKTVRVVLVQDGSM